MQRSNLLYDIQFKNKGFWQPVRKGLTESEAEIFVDSLLKRQERSKDKKGISK